MTYIYTLFNNIASDVSGRQKLGLENSGFEIFSDLTPILTFFPS